MRGREIGWGVLLAGLPLAPFLARLLRIPSESMDLWHAQSLWAQAGTLCLALVAWTSPARHTSTNWPVRLWGFYVIGTLLWLSTTWMMDNKTYHFPLMMFTAHLLLLLVFYHTATSTWTPEFLHQAVVAMTVVGLLLCVYGVLQALGFDQFFRTTIGQGGHGDEFPRNTRVIATIGNPSHFAAYLSMMAPGVLLLSKPWKMVGGVLMLLTIALTKSWGGVLALGIAVAWGLTTRWKWCLGYLMVCVCAVVVVYGAEPGYFSLSGRWQRWELFWQLFNAKPLLGMGPGSVYSIVSQINDNNHPLYHWRHVHQEWLQLGIEQGLIGVGLVGAIVLRSLKHAWDFRTHPLGLVLGMSLVAFLMNSLYNFPAHLWAVGVFGLVAVCGLEVLYADYV